MMSELWIWILLFLCLGILMIFIGIAANRKWKGFQLVDLKDYRNPSKGPTKRWAMFNSAKDSYIKLYSNIFRPMKSGMNPPHDLRGFDWQGRVFALVGVSGHPDDDNRVLIHIPIVGQAGAIQYSNEMSEAVITTLSMKEAIDKKKLKFDDEVEYNDKKYLVKGISHRGVLLSYYDTIQKPDKKGNMVEHQVEKTLPLTEIAEIAKLKIIKTNAENRAPGLSDHFSPDWVFETLGVVPVEDPNLILRADKDAISSFNSKVTERQQSVMSLFGRYPWLLPMVIMIFVVTISSAIWLYTITQDTSSFATTMQATGTAAINHIAGISSSTPLPKPANTITG